MRAVGFTGTREGMKPAQLETLRLLIRGATRLHHGDCVGADVEAHAIAIDCGVPTEGHPPENRMLRAFTNNDRDHLPLPYLQRNRAIVDATTELIACPGKMEESRRSGTWATVRHARATGKPVMIIWPTGDVKLETAHVAPTERAES